MKNITSFDQRSNDQSDTLDQPYGYSRLNWWWLSFASNVGPGRALSLGVAILQGSDHLRAVARSHELGLNPGGDILAVELNQRWLPAAEYRERLLTPADACELASAISAKRRRSEN